MEQLLIEVTQPAKLTGLSLTAGFVWWLTRGGGMLATVLMSVPAWRHMDLLPVMARGDDDDDGEDERDRPITGDAGRPEADVPGPVEGDDRADSQAGEDDEAVAELFDGR